MRLQETSAITNSQTGLYEQTPAPPLKAFIKGCCDLNAAAEVP